MAYSDFSLSQVKKDFSLVEKSAPLFSNVAALAPSPWLQETLNASLRLALASSSEKARPEFIIAPILIELERRYTNALSIYSGEKLDLDRDRGLTGECDFILAKGAMALTLQPPIMSLGSAARHFSSRNVRSKATKAIKADWGSAWRRCWGHSDLMRWRRRRLIGFMAV